MRNDSRVRNIENEGGVCGGRVVLVVCLKPVVLVRKDGITQPVSAIANDIDHCGSDRRRRGLCG